MSKHLLICNGIYLTNSSNSLARSLVDIFEVQPGPVKQNTEQFIQMSVGQPFASHSLQVAPGKSFKRPGPGNWPGPGEWYENPKLKFGPER